MIPFQRITRHVGAEPFRPFRISLASGRTFEIRHPEMVQVGRTTMTIFSFPFEESGESKERQIKVSLLLTKSIEPLDANVPQKIE